jgi:glycosyltransferase involved in cell wall biosynthesis
MRVALVSFDFGEYCVRLAGGIARYAEVLLCLPRCEAEPYKYLLDKAVSLEEFHKPRLRQMFRQGKMAQDLIRRIRNFNPDVIHLQQGHMWFNFALPLLGRYPLVVTSHDPVTHVGEKTPQWIFDWGCHRAGQIIVHAPQMKELIVRRLRLRDSRVHVITHVLCGDDSAQAHVQEEEHLILFFGRISKYKGLEYLIQAEPMISAEDPQARFVIAGTGEDMEPYRRMMTNPGRFMIQDEYISDERRAELFRRASVVVLPYVEATQSGVVPMAYSFGKPVVATSVGGLPSQIDHGETGFLVPPRDANALATGVVRLLCNRDLRHRFGANGKRKLTVEANPDTVARETSKVYQLALNEGTQS